MTVQQLIEALNQHPVEFNDVMNVIETHYNFIPTRFINGEQINEAETNNGSCKIFAFAQLNGLSAAATLNAFGRFYTEDVLQNPDGEDHANIRNFIKTGWEGIRIDQAALSVKSI